MGWLFTIVFLIGYTFNSDPFWLIAAGLFAISGGMSEVGNAIRKMFVEEVNLDEMKD